jgi:hypothetical protein
MFVAGCHRSGTSLVAGVVSGLLQQHSGASAAAEVFEDLPPALDNPAGFFESQLLNQLNDQALEQIVCDWRHPPLLPIQPGEPHWQGLIQQWRSQLRRYALEQHWIDKDPRLCITLPLYQHLLLKRVPVLAVLRDPLEVAVSLHVRDGIDLNWALCLWFLYNHHLALALQPADAVVAYAPLLEADGQDAAAKALAPWLAEQLKLSVAPAELMDRFSQQVNPGLQRSAAAHQDQALLQQLDPRLLQWSQSTAKALEQDARAAGVVHTTAFVDAFAPLPALWQRALAAEGDALFWHERSPRQLTIQLQLQQQASDVLQDQLAQRELELEDVRAAHAASEHQRLSLTASWSWRLMGPLRRVMDWLKRPRSLS